LTNGRTRKKIRELEEEKGKGKGQRTKTMGMGMRMRMRMIESKMSRVIRLVNLRLKVKVSYPWTQVLYWRDYWWIGRCLPSRKEKSTRTEKDTSF
jgi:hypothetical protein